MAALDGAERSASKTSPMEIAHNPLFTAREKIELLNKLKAEVTGEDVNPDHLAYEPEEIDAAIQEIKLDAQDGKSSESTILGGGFGQFK